MVPDTFSSADYPTYESVELGSVIAGGGFEVPPGTTDPTFSGWVRPLGAGEFYGFRWGIWNGTGFLGSATQMVDMAPHAGKPYEFSAWLASRVLDSDYAIVGLEFFEEPSGSGASLGGVVFDGNDQASPFIVGSLNIDGFADPTVLATQDNWTLYRASGTIPIAAKSAAVVIQGATVTGVNGEDGYVDLVSLQVIPEPASAALLLTGIVPALLIWRHRRAV